MSSDIENHKIKKGVVLLSGGLDSITVLEMARSEGFEIHTLTFSYGQRHAIELKSVKRLLARHPVASHKFISLDLRAFGGSALTDNWDVPKGESLADFSADIPTTYVPARNTIFLSFALAYAETIQSFDIFMGMNADDYGHYPDCRPEYLSCFEKLANLATAAGVRDQRKMRVHAPLLHMSKADIIKKGMGLGIDYSLTMSCYDPTPEGLACNTCHACTLRREGFRQNGLLKEETKQLSLEPA